MVFKPRQVQDVRIVKFKEILVINIMIGWLKETNFYWSNFGWKLWNSHNSNFSQLKFCHSISYIFLVFLIIAIPHPNLTPYPYPHPLPVSSPLTRTLTPYPYPHPHPHPYPHSWCYPYSRFSNAVKCPPQHRLSLECFFILARVSSPTTLKLSPRSLIPPAPHNACRIGPTSSPGLPSHYKIGEKAR